MSTLGDVTAMLSLITPYQMPINITEAQLLYDIGMEAVSTDLVGATDLIQTRGCCYYIAHLLSTRDGSSRATSEHLGEWSIGYAASVSGSSQWLDAYHRLIASVKRGALISSPVIVDIDDITLSRKYPLDEVVI